MNFRKNGYYWVRFINLVDWEIAEWDFQGQYWLLIGSSDVYCEDVLSEINEERIDGLV